MSEKPTIAYLGNYEFDIGGRRVVFHRVVKAKQRGYVATLSFDGGGDAAGFASLLNAAGVRAELIDNVVRLDAESLVGLMVCTSATPPGFLRLYSSPHLHVFAEVDGARVYFYFAVRHGGVWRALRGMYSVSRVSLWTRECGLAEKLRGELAGALGIPLNAVPLNRYGKRCRVPLYVPHLSRLLQHAAEGVEAKPISVSLDSGFLRIRTGGVDVKLEFELAKTGIAKYIAADLPKALQLYSSIRALGMPVGLTPEGVRLSNRAMWALLALAVEGVEPVTEILPGVLLAGKYDVDGHKLFAFVYTPNDEVIVRFVLSGSGWKSASGRLYKSRVHLRGNIAEVADAINAIYLKMGVNRRVVVSGDVLVLALRDLALLGLKTTIVRLALERAKRHIASSSQTPLFADSGHL